jgi:hypothetical protein
VLSLRAANYYKVQEDSIPTGSGNLTVMKLRFVSQILFKDSFFEGVLD